MPAHRQGSGTASRRKLIKVAGGSLAAVTLAGCAGEDDPAVNDSDGGDGNGNGGSGDNSITVSQSVHTDTLDPQDFTGSPARGIIMAGYDKLMNLDYLGDHSLIPELATNWEWVEETTLELELREGVTWHNGDEFTAEDAVFSVKRVGDSEFDMATRRVLENFDDAEAIDDYTMQIHLTQLDPIFHQKLAGSGGIVNASWIQDNEESEIAQSMNGTGAYQLEEFTPEERAVFSKNEEWWGNDADNQPDLDSYPEELVYVASAESSTRVGQVIAEEADVIGEVPPEDVGRIEEEDHTAVEAAATSRSCFLLMRYDVEPFTSVEFRQALNYAVNVDQVIENTLEGFGDRLTQVNPPFWFGHNPDIDPWPHDPEQAAELVQESGHNGAEIEITVPSGRYLKGEEVVMALADQIDQVEGITCEPDIIDVSTWQDIRQPELENKPAFQFVGAGSNPPDSTIKLDRYLTCEMTDEHYSTFCNDQIDELAQAARETLDEDEREEILQEYNRVVVEEVTAVVPLYLQYGIWGINNRVGFEPNPDEEIYWDMMTLDG